MESTVGFSRMRHNSTLERANRWRSWQLCRQFVTAAIDGNADGAKTGSHAPHDGYDFIPVDFLHIAAALHDREYVASQHSVPRDASL